MLATRRKAAKPGFAFALAVEGKRRAVHTARVRSLLFKLSSLALFVSGCADEGPSCPPLDESAAASVTEHAGRYRYPVQVGPKGQFEAFVPNQDHGLVIDRFPHLRGPHDYTVITRDAQCEMVASAHTDLRPNPAFAVREFGVAQSQAIGKALVLYNDPRDYEARTYERIGALIGLTGQSFLNPPLAEAQKALRETFGSLDETQVGLLVLAGEGHRERAGLALGKDETLWLNEVSATVSDLAAKVGLLVVVADIAHGHHLMSQPLPPQTLVLFASQATHPWPPRLDSEGPGALASAWLHHLEASAQARCLPSVGKDLGEVSQWLESSFLGLRDTLVERVRGPLPVELPYTLSRVAQTPPKPQGCSEQLDCARREAANPTCQQTCHRLVCIEGACLAQVDTLRGCDDGNACTINDHCTPEGRCESEALTCSTTESCKAATCDPILGCVLVDDPTGSCDDGDPCTYHDTCTPEGGCAGTRFSCDDGNPCTEDSCESIREGESLQAACVHRALNGLACDDGNLCTVGDQCRQGICQGSPKPCSDGNACTLDACDSTTGECKSSPGADFVSCDDGNACTTFDRCEGGVCQGLATVCDDGLSCTLDRCTGLGQCEHLPLPGFCLDQGSCIPVGEPLLSNPCQRCLQTNLVGTLASDEGQSCGPSRAPCHSQTCQAGQCRDTISPTQCLTADDSCVDIGAPVGECLTCLGGGRVSANINQSCQALGDGCGSGTCNAFGQCQWSDQQCCDSLELACDTTLRIPVSELYNDYPSWSIGQGMWPSSGPDRWLTLQSPCAGRVTITSRTAGALFAIPTSACNTLPAEASTVVSQWQRFVPGAGESLALVLEANAQHTEVEIQVECVCNP